MPLVFGSLLGVLSLWKNSTNLSQHLALIDSPTATCTYTHSLGLELILCCFLLFLKTACAAVIEVVIALQILVMRMDMRKGIPVIRKLHTVGPFIYVKQFNSLSNRFTKAVQYSCLICQRLVQCSSSEYMCFKTALFLRSCRHFSCGHALKSSTHPNKPAKMKLKSESPAYKYSSPCRL